MGTTHFCDVCGTVGVRLYNLPIYVHIKNQNRLDGHHQVIKIDGEKSHTEPFSGRTENTDMCIVCYNKVMLPLWESIKDQISQHKTDNNG